MLKVSIKNMSFMVTFSFILSLYSFASVSPGKNVSCWTWAWTFKIASAQPEQQLPRTSSEAGGHPVCVRLSVPAGFSSSSLQVWCPGVYVSGQGFLVIMALGGPISGPQEVPRHLLCELDTAFGCRYHVQLMLPCYLWPLYLVERTFVLSPEG